MRLRLAWESRIGCLTGNAGRCACQPLRRSIRCRHRRDEILTFLLAFGRVDFVGHSVGVRRTAAASTIVLALIVFAPRAGEPDRTESIAVGTLRAIVSGEKAYASANDGYFDTPACLTLPSCIPGTARGSRPYLALGVIIGLERRGYQIEFEPGPKAERGSGKQRSPSAMTGFAVVAIPTTPMTSRRRAFCADDRETIYVTSGGTRPAIVAGRCFDTSSPLR
jgi:hypothetical protein